MNYITNLTALTTSSEISMTSKEIAELVNSRHDSVKRSIERLIEQGVITQPPLVEVPFIDDLGRNRTTSAYVFSGEQGKRDSIVVVAQLSPQFTAALVDRWQELEKQISSIHNQLTPALHAAALAPAMVKAFEAFGFVGNQAVLSANRAVTHITNIDLLKITGNSALVAPDNEPLITPTAIAKKLEISARAVNPLLVAAGLQTQERDHKGHPFYELTEEGSKYGTYLDVGKKHSDGTPVRQLKWKSSVIPLVEVLLSQ